MRLIVDRFGRIVIPKRLRDRLGLPAGAEVDVELAGDTLVLRPVSPEPVLVHEGAVLVAHASLDA